MGKERRPWESRRIPSEMLPPSIEGREVRRKHSGLRPILTQMQIGGLIGAFFGCYAGYSKLDGHLFTRSALVDALSFVLILFPMLILFDWLRRADD